MNIHVECYAGHRGEQRRERSEPGTEEGMSQFVPSKGEVGRLREAFDL